MNMIYLTTLVNAHSPLFSNEKGPLVAVVNPMRPYLQIFQPRRQYNRVWGCLDLDEYCAQDGQELIERQAVRLPSTTYLPGQGLHINISSPLGTSNDSLSRAKGCHTNWQVPVNRTVSGAGQLASQMQTIPNVLSLKLTLWVRSRMEQYSNLDLSYLEVSSTIGINRGLDVIFWQLAGQLLSPSKPLDVTALDANKQIENPEVAYSQGKGTAKEPTSKGEVSPEI
ncbi:hypothetical protein L218DRAFT_550094 [Marasmius fiardii PR-910]|nr:hypothetical protein L218DRAFT_550094 [Marasmius fiardii PR-910]